LCKKHNIGDVLAEAVIKLFESRGAYASLTKLHVVQQVLGALLTPKPQPNPVAPRLYVLTLTLTLNHALFRLSSIFKFAFILSPRMWQRPELLMLMCILVDKDLQYTSINQKDNRSETSQNRSMACLPVRVQRVIYDRLKVYHCVPENCVSRDYGGVALCSGGSYKSYYDWFYLPTSLFEADISSKEGDLIAEIAGAPKSLLANGPYVRTKDRFNGKPVYAQLNEVEFGKFKDIIADGSGLSARLKAAVPSFLKEARTGERLLVRNHTNDAWIVQSVSAYKGFTIRGGDCGFHVLKVPDSKAHSVCFKGMPRTLKGDPIMQRCAAQLTFWETTHQDFDREEYQFSFGSKRCAGSVHVPGILCKPQPTRQQAFHTDGPVKVASLWSANGFNVAGGDNEKDLPLGKPDSWFLSALCAFFDLTGLGVLGGQGHSLRLDIPIGQCVIFRFDFFHHGWKCVDDTGKYELPVHFRAHFYLFCESLRELPVPDFEAALEFLSCLSHGDMDDGTKLLLLECLQTFLPDSGRRSSLVDAAKKRQYSLLDDQRSLDRHVKPR
jgi:hypothetical protein